VNVRFRPLTISLRSCNIYRRSRPSEQPTRELGYHRIERAVDAPLFASVDETFVAFVSHGDDIVELPLGARKLAHSQHALHGFRKAHAFGVLFPPITTTRRRS